MDSHYSRALITENGLAGFQRGFRVRTISFYLGPYTTLNIGHLFERYNKEYTLEVIVYSRSRMSEFGLPVFFGETDLQPIKTTFKILPYSSNETI